MCEGTHSRWKWIESGKRNLKFKYLNALLKLQTWLQNNNGAFPDDNDLVPYIVEARRQRLWRIEDLRAEGMPIYIPSRPGGPQWVSADADPPPRPSPVEPDRASALPSTPRPRPEAT